MMGSDDEVFAISGPKHMMARSGTRSSPTMTTVKVNWYACTVMLADGDASAYCC